MWEIGLAMFIAGLAIVGGFEASSATPARMNPVYVIACVLVAVGVALLSVSLAGWVVDRRVDATGHEERSPGHAADWRRRGARREDFRYEAVDVRMFDDAMKNRAIDLSAVPPDTSLWAEVKVKNVGRIPWAREGPTPIRLGTWNEQDHRGIFLSAGWASGNRPAKLLEDEVLPGDVATFEFPVITPSEPGDWVEHLNVVAENWTWAPETDLALRVHMTLGATDVS